MKRIESPVPKRWPGYVLLHDPISLLCKADFEDAIDEARRKSPKLNTSRAHVILLPALLPCVAEWHLENFPSPVSLENFPGIGSDIDGAMSGDLVVHLINSIIELYERKPETDPNA